MDNTYDEQKTPLIQRQTGFSDNNPSGFISSEPNMGKFSPGHEDERID
jgi:hypothetical protein